MRSRFESPTAPPLSDGAQPALRLRIDLQGNPLTEDDELKKLKPVVDTATKVWGVRLVSLSCRSHAGLASERYTNGDEEGNRRCGRFVESIEHFAGHRR